MAVTLLAAGTYAAGTTSVTPTIPTSTAYAAGDLLVCVVHAKPTNTAIPPIFITPAGWTLLGSAHDGSGTAQGTDAGQVWSVAYALQATSGSETNPVCAVTNGNVCMGVVNTWRKAVAGAWAIQTVFAGDTSSGTAWSTAHAAMNLKPGDGLDYKCAASGNGSGGSASIFPTTIDSLTATGHTFFAGGPNAASNTNNGTDMAAGGYNLQVATGTSSSVTLTLAATLLAAQKGNAVFIKLREPMSATVTQISSAHTAQTFGEAKSRAIGQPDGLHVAQPIEARKMQYVSLVQTAESTTGTTMDRMKSRIVGQGGTLNEAQIVNPFRSARSEPFAAATETDTAQVVARLKTRLIGQTLETATAQAVAGRKAETLAQVVESSTAQPAGRTKARAFVSTSEIDTAELLGERKSRLLAQVTSTELAQALDERKARIVAQALEASTAAVTGERKALAFAATLETNAAMTLGEIRSRVIAVALEADTSGATGERKARLLGQVLEVDTAAVMGSSASSPGQFVAVGRVLEVDTAGVQGRGKARLVTGVGTLSTAGAAGRTRSRAVVQVLEANSPVTLGRASSRILGLVTSTDLARPVSLGTSRPVALVVESTTSGGLAVVKTRLLGLVLEADLAQAVGAEGGVLIVIDDAVLLPGGIVVGLLPIEDGVLEGGLGVGLLDDQDGTIVP